MRTLFRKTAFTNNRSVDFSQKSGRVNFRFPDTGRNTRVRRGDSRSNTSPSTDVDRDVVLSRLKNLVSSSIGGYAEIGGSFKGLRLQAFATVVIRQRLAQRKFLGNAIGRLNDRDDRLSKGELAEFRSVWRHAAVSLEEGDFPAFAEAIERAESLLEEAYLGAAKCVSDKQLASDLREYAVMVCGARSIVEELGDADGLMCQAKDER